MKSGRPHTAARPRAERVFLWYAALWCGVSVVGALALAAPFQLVR